MKIAVAGDYYSNNDMSVPEISSELIDLFKSCDLAILNYEGPVTVGKEAIPEFKTGPNTQQNSKSIPYLKDCGITTISVANNHLYDFGKYGLETTISAATNSSLDVIGFNEFGKVKPKVFEKDGTRLVVLAYAEEEWCGPRNHQYSIALLDVIDVSRDINHYISIADAVIVILHGNNEYNCLPSPNLQKQARFFIDQGAIAVLIHHAHVVSGVEYWCDRPIIYGLGNFQFTLFNPYPGFYEGLVAILSIHKENQSKVSVSLELVPTHFDENTYQVDLARSNLKEQILNEVSGLSICLESQPAIDANFFDFSYRMHKMYWEMLNPFYGEQRFFKLVGRLWVQLVVLKNRRFATMLNALRCQSHRDVMGVLWSGIRNNSNH